MAINNIFIVNGDFKFLKPLQKNFPMMYLKSNAGFHHERLTYSCKDAIKDLTIHNWHFSAIKCPARITTEGLTDFLAKNSNAPHNHSVPENA